MYRPVQPWLARPNTDNLIFRLFDIDADQSEQYQLWLLVPNGSLTVTTQGGLALPDKGRWRAPSSTTIHITVPLLQRDGSQAPLREFIFLLIDGTESFQEFRTREMLLIPYSTNYIDGPTVQSRAQTQIDRQTAFDV